MFSCFFFFCYMKHVGEYVFMECSTQALVTNQIVSPGARKSCEENLLFVRLCFSVT